MERGIEICNVDRGKGAGRAAVCDKEDTEL